MKILSQTQYSRILFKRTSRLWISLLALSLSTLSYGQSDHDEHDHAEEADHDENHEAHSDHDEHRDEEEAHGESREEHGEHGHDEHEGPIKLDALDMEDFGIRVAAAGPGVVHETLRIPGEVRMNENAMGHVSPRFDGVVTMIHKRLGELVRRGDVLAEMESNETLRPFELKAPLDGVIVAFHITPGESMSAGETAYTIADTSTVWVDLRAYQRDLPKVHNGQEIRVSAGHEYPDASGEVSYVGPVIDEVTRTGLVRAVIPNPDGLYRPGLFLIGNVLLDEFRLPIVVPRSAVHTIDNQEVVFVEAEEGEGFEPSPVVTGRFDSNNIEIRSGLEQGERYVSQGGFFLKADSMKENFGDGHAH